MNASTHEAPSTALDTRLLGAIMEKSPDAIYFKDLQSRFIRVNNRMAMLFNLDHPSQLIGKTDFDFFTEEHARPAFNDEQAVMRTGLPILDKVEKEIQPDGTITWASTNKFPYYDDDGILIGTFGISRDITAQKSAEEEARLAQEQLLANARKAAVAEFAGSVFSHFADQVANIIDTADRIRSQTAEHLPEGPETENIKADIEELRQCAHQLNQLINLQNL